MKTWLLGAVFAFMILSVGCKTTNYESTSTSDSDERNGTAAGRNY